MTPSEHSREHTIRLELARAEEAYERRPDDHALRTEVVHWLLRLVEVVQQSHPPSAHRIAERAVELAKESFDSTQGAPPYASLFADALVQFGVIVQEEDRMNAPLVFQRALVLLEGLAKSNPDDQALRTRLGTCHGHLAIALDDSGSNDAFGHYRMSLAISEELAQAHPADSSAQNNLARAHNAIGFHYSESDRLIDSIAHHQKSLAFNAKLVERQPEKPNWSYCLATDHENLSDAYTRSGDLEQALEHARKALEIRQSICEDEHAPAEWVSLVAESHRGVAELEQERGDRETALQHFRAAVEIEEEMLRGSPGRDEYLAGAAASHLMLGEALESTQQFEASLAAYRAALRFYEALIRKHPDEPGWHTQLAHSHLCSTIALLLLDRRDEARSHAEQGIAILDEQIRSARLQAERSPHILRTLQTDLATFHTELADTLAARGDREAALSHFEIGLEINRQLVRSDPEASVLLANLATNLDGVAALHEQYGDLERAVDFSRQAVSAEEGLAKLDPESTDYQGRVIQSLISYAGNLREFGDLQRAMDTMQRARRLARRLKRLVPRDAFAAGLAAQVQRGLGLVYRDLREHTAAEQAFLDASSRIAELRQESPNPDAWRGQTAETLEHLADLYIAIGRADEAVTAAESALTDRQRIAELRPDDPLAQRDLATCLELTAEACETVGDLDRATAHRKAASRLYERFGEGGQ